MAVLKRQQQANVILLVVGIGLLGASLLADGIGIGDDPGFGLQQTMGSIAGVVITVVGVFLLRRSGEGEKGERE